MGHSWRAKEVSWIILNLEVGNQLDYFFKEQIW